MSHHTGFYDAIQSYYNETFIPILIELGYDVDRIKNQITTDGLIFKSDEMLSKFLDTYHGDKTKIFDAISGENKLPFEFITLTHLDYFYIIESNKLYNEIINMADHIKY